METKEQFNAQPKYPRQRPPYQIESRLGVYKSWSGRSNTCPCWKTILKCPAHSQDCNNYAIPILKGIEKTSIRFWCFVLYKQMWVKKKIETII
jgi:hypothetical protein